MRTARARVHATLVNWKAQYRGKRKLSQEESPGKEEPRKKRKEASKQKKKGIRKERRTKGLTFQLASSARDTIPQEALRQKRRRNGRIEEGCWQAATVSKTATTVTSQRQ